MNNTLLNLRKQKKLLPVIKYCFNFVPTPGQLKIIKKIFFKKHKRLVINCMTQYGKTRSISVAVGLYVLANPDKKIALIGPTYKQTSILRNYIAELIAESEQLSAMVGKHREGSKRLVQQLSHDRITFTNGCELIVLSAEGQAKRLAGFGADMVIIDESALIKGEVYRSKISRMLGANPDAVLVEISNPWTTDNHYYEHWMSPRFERVHIGWEQALEEGRVSKDFIDEQRATLTPIEFRVLYESQFPEQAVDSVFNDARIEDAWSKTFETEPIDVIIGCDPADKGLDLTVIWTAYNKGNQWDFRRVFHEQKSEQTAIAGRILEMAKQDRVTRIKIDYGMGVGVISMVKERLENKKIQVSACKFGEAAFDKDRFLNKKAEMYFYLAELFNQGMIRIPKHETLIKELRGIKWRYTSGNKIQIIDPEKSPDFADAMVCTVWRGGESGFYAA